MWLSGPVSFYVRHPSPTTLRSLSTCFSLWLLYLSCSACPTPSQSERATHTQCGHVVLAGNQWAASIWRPWHLWLPRQSWRSRDSLGPCVFWRLRWQLWDQLSRRLLGPRRLWRGIQPRDQHSGTSGHHPGPDACHFPPFKPTLLAFPPCPSRSHAQSHPPCRQLWPNLLMAQG